MSTLRIALLQMTAYGADQSANLVKGDEFCRRARAMGADIALFPEMWNIGYTGYAPAQPGAREQWQKQAIRRDDEFVTRFQSLAHDLRMAIAITYLEEWQGGPRNSVSLVDRHGKIAMTYAKVHTCAFDWEGALTPGDAFHTCELDTLVGPVRIGAMICYDREFPESARVLMLQGAEIILTPNACTLEANRLTQYRARAFENMVGLAMANYAAPQANGNSIAVDAEMFAADESSLDPIIVQAGEGEGVYLADFNLDRLRSYRARESWGNAFRRPETYAALTAREVREPFIRSNVKG
jgi:predicted amidohydrolase